MLSLREVTAFFTKELIFGFQILDLKDHFSASLMFLFFNYLTTDPEDEPRMQKSIPDNIFLIVKN